jgi:hypothetical protein
MGKEGRGMAKATMQKVASKAVKAMRVVCTKLNLVALFLNEQTALLSG